MGARQVLVIPGISGKLTQVLIKIHSLHYTNIVTIGRVELQQQNIVNLAVNFKTEDFGLLGIQKNNILWQSKYKA